MQLFEQFHLGVFERVVFNFKLLSTEPPKASTSRSRNLVVLRSVWQKHLENKKGHILTNGVALKNDSTLKLTFYHSTITQQTQILNAYLFCFTHSLVTR